MIYRATWEDGRQLVLRASSPDDAGKYCLTWRQNDPALEPGTPPSPTLVETLFAKGPVDILLSGWESAA